MLMESEEKTIIERIGRKAGFLFYYFVFTALLHLFLGMLNKEFGSWPNYYVMGLVLVISLLGAIIRKLLK